MRISTAFLAILPIFLSAACDDDGGGGGGGDNPVDAAIEDTVDSGFVIADARPLSASCIEAMNHSDLEWIQDNIITPGCAAFSSCHKGAATQAGGLNLESGQTEASMVNVTSNLFTDWKMIVPGDPANSYLMVILGDEIGPLKDGVGTMPYNNPTLCKPKLDAVSRWVSGLQ